MSAPIDTGVLAAGGNFLVTPELGLMLWTLIAFGVAMFLLRRLAYPRIQSALEKRARAVAETIDAAERAIREAEPMSVHIYIEPDIFMEDYQPEERLPVPEAPSH